MIQYIALCLHSREGLNNEGIFMGIKQTHFFSNYTQTHTPNYLVGEFDKFVFCKLRISKTSFMSIQGNDLKFQSWWLCKNWEIFLSLRIFQWSFFLVLVMLWIFICWENLNFGSAGTQALHLQNGASLLWSAFLLVIASLSLSHPLTKKLPESCLSLLLATDPPIDHPLTYPCRSTRLSF